MSSSTYEANDIWDVLVTAAVQQTTVETVCGLLETALSVNTVRNAIKALLMEQKRLTELEATVNKMLVARLPKNLLKRGATHFHSFTTLCVSKPTGVTPWGLACIDVRIQY